MDASPQPPISIVNPQKFMYLAGDAYTDGSMRVQVDPINNDKFHFEIRQLGVWKDSSLLAAVGSLSLGRDLSIESAGGFIKTVSSSEGGVAARLVPHIHFNDVLGSFGLHAPHITPMKYRDDWQWVYDGESAPSLNFSYQFEWDENAFISKIYLKIGSFAPASDDVVQFTIHKGDINGVEYYQNRWMGSDFPANTEVEIDLEGIVQLISDVHAATNDVTFHLEVFGQNGEPGTPMSLLTKASTGAWWLAFDIQRFLAVGILSDNLVLDDDLNLIYDNDLNFVSTVQIFNKQDLD